MIKMGEKVKDRFTGFQGIVRARTEYLHGCVSVAVLDEKLNKETGKPAEWVWFDEQRIDNLSQAKSGGPQPVAPSR